MSFMIHPHPELVTARGTSILGEVRNVEISRVGPGNIRPPEGCLWKNKGYSAAPM